MNKEEKLKISKMLREKDIDDKLEIYLSPDLYCYVHNYIVDLKMQIDQLTNNWNELEEWLKDKYKKYSDNFISNIVEEFDIYFANDLTDFDKTSIVIDIVRKIDNVVLDKMKEIKGGNNDKTRTN